MVICLKASDEMVDFGEMGSVHICHSVILFLGYYSLLHPLKTIFIWTVSIAYCASLLFKQLRLSDLTLSIFLHYHAASFLLFCIILSIIKFRCSRLFEKPTLYRLGANFRARRFYHLLLFATLSSFIVSIAFNGDLSHHDVIGCGIVLIISDWGSIPVLIKVSSLNIFIERLLGLSHCSHVWIQALRSRKLFQTSFR